MTYQDGMWLIVVFSVMLVAVLTVVALLARRLREHEALTVKLFDLIKVLVSTLFGRGRKK